ncbi:MAG: hypothetical protein ABSH34_37040 [Verrucomicrobiota bacterium]|jgi:hypothetical protein
MEPNGPNDLTGDQGIVDELLSFGDPWRHFGSDAGFYRWLRVKAPGQAQRARVMAAYIPEIYRRLKAEEAGRGGPKFDLFLPCPGQPARSRRNPHPTESP